MSRLLNGSKDNAGMGVDSPLFVDVERTARKERRVESRLTSTTYRTKFEGRSSPSLKMNEGCLLMI